MFGVPWTCVVASCTTGSGTGNDGWSSCRFLKSLRARWPGGKLYLICDNYSVHGLGVLVGSMLTGVLVDLMPSTGWGSAAPWCAVAVTLLAGALVRRPGGW